MTAFPISGYVLRFNEKTALSPAEQMHGFFTSETFFAMGAEEGIPVRDPDGEIIGKATVIKTAQGLMVDHLALDNPAAQEVIETLVGKELASVIASVNESEDVARQFSVASVSVIPLPADPKGAQ